MSKTQRELVDLITTVLAVMQATQDSSSEEVGQSDIEIGESVIVRSSGSGVWFGALRRWDARTRTVSLRNARKVWSWEGASATSGLAVTGPSKGKICAPVTAATVADVLEVLACTTESVAQFERVEAWVA